MPEASLYVLSPPPEGVTQEEFWVQTLSFFPEPLGSAIKSRVVLLEFLIDVLAEPDPDAVAAGRFALASLIASEDGKNPDCVDHPWVAALMMDAIELMHGRPELATVREEARPRNRGRTDAPR